MLHPHAAKTFDRCAWIGHPNESHGCDTDVIWCTPLTPHDLNKNKSTDPKRANAVQYPKIRIMSSTDCSSL